MVKNALFLGQELNKFSGASHLPPHKNPVHAWELVRWGPFAIITKLHMKNWFGVLENLGLLAKRFEFEDKCLPLEI